MGKRKSVPAFWGNKKTNNAIVELGKQMFMAGGKKSKVTSQDKTLVFMFTVLHEEFGFGKARLQRTLKAFNDKVDSLAYKPNQEDGITTETLKEILKDETGFTFYVEGALK